MLLGYQNDIGWLQGLKLHLENINLNMHFLIVSPNKDPEGIHLKVGGIYHGVSQVAQEGSTV